MADIAGDLTTTLDKNAEQLNEAQLIGMLKTMLRKFKSGAQHAHNTLQKFKGSTELKRPSLSRSTLKKCFRSDSDKQQASDIIKNAKKYPSRWENKLVKILDEALKEKWRSNKYKYNEAEALSLLEYMRCLSDCLIVKRLSVSTGRVEAFQPGIKAVFESAMWLRQQGQLKDQEFKLRLILLGRMTLDALEQSEKEGKTPVCGRSYKLVGATLSQFVNIKNVPKNNRHPLKGSRRPSGRREPQYRKPKPFSPCLDDIVEEPRAAAGDGANIQGSRIKISISKWIFFQ